MKLTETATIIKVALGVGATILGLGSSWAMMSYKQSSLEERQTASERQLITVDLEQDRQRIHEQKVDDALDAQGKMLEKIDRKLDRMMEHHER